MIRKEKIAGKGEEEGRQSGGHRAFWGGDSQVEFCLE